MVALYDEEKRLLTSARALEMVRCIEYRELLVREIRTLIHERCLANAADGWGEYMTVTVMGEPDEK